MDQETEVIKNLISPVKSFRLSAIGCAFNEGCSNMLFLALVDRLKNESDDECRQLLYRAIEAVKRRQSPRNVSVENKFDSNKFFTEFAVSDASEKMEILGRIPTDKLSLLAQSAPEWVKGERDNQVCAALIRFFYKHWPMEQLAILSSKLFSESLSIRLAALEALIYIAPASLINDLPQYLVYPDPRVRALAIRGLYAVDQDEALAHFENLLASSDPNHKKAALQIIFDFPFDVVKPILLRFFTIENAPEILRQVGTLFEINPDIDVPYRLYEIAEASKAEKAEALKYIIRSSCKAIKSAGCVKEDFDRYLASLQDWVNKRRGARFVQRILARLSQDDSVTSLELETIISKNLGNSSIRSALEEALNWPLGSRIRERLVEIIESSGGKIYSADSSASQKEVVKTGADKAKKLGSLFPEKKKDNSCKFPISEIIPVKAKLENPAVSSHARKEEPLNASKTIDEDENTYSSSYDPGKKKEVFWPFPEDDEQTTKTSEDSTKENFDDQTESSDEPVEAVESNGDRQPAESVPCETDSFDGNAEPSILPDFPPLEDEASLETIVRQVSSFKERDKSLAKPIIENLLKSSKTKPDVRAVAFRAAVRLGLGGYGKYAEICLKIVDNSSLVTGALEYLDRFECARIIPVIEKFLRSSDPLIKSAALKILKNLDPLEAVSLALEMLGEKDLKQQELALSCMIHLDFPLLRKRLTTFLSTSARQKLIEMGLCLFQANPDPDNLFCLFTIEKNLPPEAADMVRTVRFQQEEVLVKLGLIAPVDYQTRESQFTERWIKEKARKNAPDSPYSMNALHLSKGEKSRGIAGVAQRLLERFGFSA